MAELVAERMSPLEQQRWMALLERPPLAARRALRVDPALMVFGAALCSFAFIVTFYPAVSSTWLVGGVRTFGVAGCALCLALGVEGWRARRSIFPSGLFLFDWGCAEVDHGTIRVIPRSDLTYQIRGRRLGVGWIRLRLRAAGWSTSIAISADEAERIAIAWEDADENALIPATGYREPAMLPGAPGEATGSRWIDPRARPFLLAAVLAALGAAALPREATAAATIVTPASRPPSGYTAAFDAALAPRAGETAPSVAVELESCTFNQMRLDTVTSYLELALERRRLGPLDLGAIPNLTTASSASVRVWARCEWSVDWSTGLFDHVDARWGVSRNQHVLVEHSALIDARVVASTMSTCLDGSVSPEAVAGTSLILASSVVRRDLHGAETPGSDDMAGRPACVLDQVSTIPVSRPFRTPPRDAISSREP